MTPQFLQAEAATATEATGAQPGKDRVTRQSSPAEKIALFRSLFRGREDVYPVRFESKRTGRSGYQPTCANEWVRGVCEKPRIKCADCPNRHLLPVTDEVIGWHLSGRDDRGRDFVAGVYPMLQDECCHFLAVDFDGQQWQEDALAFLQTCRAQQIPAALERSRSGNGAHVWVFFEAAVPARLARNLGSCLLTETMDNRPELGLKSYDRLFPNQVLLSTGKYLGEGFDDARLDTLFLTMPVSWRGTVAQYVGRLHRLHEGKEEVRVYDYADLNVPMLARMFDRRCRGYEAVGYTIQMPGSAVAGWPGEVPLPVDPQWKRDYAASVRRLVRDGVDLPLANLFVYAARRLSPDAAGLDRARSASEAFLYHRLETLSETAGLFRLNARLPIPFDAQGEMEVDLYCASLQVAVEVDGPQHLADPESYRRDRRKDALLQQNGCIVLRFLSQDLGTNLDAVLDTVLHAISYQRRRRA